MWCLCRKSSNHSQHQPPFSRFRLIVQKNHGPDCPVVEARTIPALRIIQHGLYFVDIHLRSKTTKSFEIYHPV